MKKYILECFFGLIVAFVIVIGSLASSISTPFIYQGF